MDGVLTDWEKQFKRYSGGIPVETYEAEHGPVKRYEFVKKNSPDFYSTMDWMGDGKLLYSFLKDLPIEILSHATDQGAVDGKLIWLKNNRYHSTLN